MAPPLRLRTFGAVHVAADGAPMGGAAGQRRLLALLAALAADRERIRRAVDGGGVLWPEADPDVRAIYGAFALLGWPTRPLGTVPDLVGGLLQYGWRALPAAVEAPQPGDLFVLTSPCRTPERLGIVSQLGPDFFVAVLPEGRSRRGLKEADFLLRPPGG